MGIGGQGNLVFLTLGHRSMKIFWGELGIKVDIGVALDIPFREHSKTIFGNKGDFVNFSTEHGSTDPPLGTSIIYPSNVSIGRLNYYSLTRTH